MDPDHTPNPTPAPEAQVSEDQAAVAGRSLADALRVSFRLLSAAMVVVLVFFAFSGWTRVKTVQRGVKLLFGEMLGEGRQRVVTPGLNWSWPEPIGRIELVSTRKRERTIKEFWLFETAEEALKPLSERTPPTSGLRPGLDGALLTGDRALVHVKLKCDYRIGTRDGQPDPDRVLAHLAHLRTRPRDPDRPIEPAGTDELLDAAVAAAAVRAAAGRTVDSIYLGNREAFAKEVKKHAQARLDALGGGIEILQVVFEGHTVPLAAIEAFDEVREASQFREDQINKARAEETAILNAAAGSAWPELVGDPERAARAGEVPPSRRPEVFHGYLAARAAGDAQAVEALREEVRRFGLLHLYADTREGEDRARTAAGDAADAGDEAAAARHRAEADRRRAFAAAVLDEINRVLGSDRVGQRAAAIKNQAEAYRNSIAERVKGEVETFNQLVAKYEESPALVMQQLWVPVKTEILSSPTVEKFYLTPTQRVVIRASRDPEARRRALRAAMEAPRKGREGERE